MRKSNGEIALGSVRNIEDSDRKRFRRVKQRWSVGDKYFEDSINFNYDRREADLNVLVE